MKAITDEASFEYHSYGKPGKIEVVPTKSTATQFDLSLAYSPGVAAPCIRIKEIPNDVYKYTAKGNLVGVITNGTSVLGLGDIGPLASKPVMEGKSVLFKIFAGIDAFDIELDADNPTRFIAAVKAMAPTFGGINLEDIKAPECFNIEHRLIRELDIPVMHDDQHGTAIITSAALLNALLLAGKRISDVRIVINGAGASAIMSAHLYVALGVKKRNILMFDSRGMITTKREGLSKEKRAFASNETKELTLAEAMRGADVFLGLSKGHVVSPDMVRSMAPNPIVFALANPTPEIEYDEAMEARSDLLMGTGRSDYPNQINNVLGFPYLFRGALDTRARCINRSMKLAAVHSLAYLAKEPVPQSVKEIYGNNFMKFDADYFIPKPFDPRLITTVAPAVARAAISSGVARSNITDWDEYRSHLQNLVAKTNPKSGGILPGTFSASHYEGKVY